VGELVDEGDLGPSLDHSVEVHLLEPGPPVIDRFPGDDLEPVDELLGQMPPMALDEPDDDVAAPPPPPLALAEHGVGLADPCGGTQVDAEMAGRLDDVGGVGLHRRGLAHPFVSPLRAAGDMPVLVHLHCLSPGPVALAAVGSRH
jgi:hypothetical protein